MKIGVVREIKPQECRVALTPDGAQQLAELGHRIFLEKGAGLGSGFSDEAYREKGACIVDISTAWQSDMVLKIKEPLTSEYHFLDGQILFTYLHLSGMAPELTEHLLQRRVTAIAYETVQDENGRLPLLAPMSAVAGDIAVNVGNQFLASFNGGKGILLGRVLERSCGKVMVIGDGIVGLHALHAALGLGCKVVLFSRHPQRHNQLQQQFEKQLKILLSNSENISLTIKDADLVIGAALIPGARTPHLVTGEMVKSMQPGSVIVDVSIDQGGCVETSHPTSHAEPVFSKFDVLHYCVTNMPGAYPRTSTIALTEATLPYVKKLANSGVKAFVDDKGFAKGLNLYQGKITCQAVAESLGKL